MVEQAKVFGKPLRTGVTDSAHDCPYWKLALKTTLPPASERLAVEAVNAETTGAGIAGSATTAGVAATTAVLFFTARPNV